MTARDQIFAGWLRQLDVWRRMPPKQRIPCILCGGTAHERCGCNGTITVADAMREVDYNPGILSK